MYRTRHNITRMSMVVLSSLLILLLIAACAGGGGDEAQLAGTEPPPEGEAGPEAAAASPTPGVPDVQCEAGQKELVWMVRNSLVENRWEADIVRPAFQQANPDICLRILSINQDDIAVRREAMIAAGEPLHVWSTNWGGDGFASDRIRGLLEDLTPFIERDNFDLSVFIPDVLKIYQAEGKTWGLPFLTTGSYIYYNKKMFDEAGVEYPPTDWNDKSWTWDKFVELAKQLTKDVEDINKAQFGGNYQVLNLEHPPMLFGYQVWSQEAYETGLSGPIDVTNEASINGFQAYHDLIYKHKVAPDPSATQALEQLGGAFAAGRIAMQMQGGWGHWSWKGLIDDPAGFCWGVAPMPWGSPDADIRTVIYTDPWVMTRGLSQEEQDMAWTFIKFLVAEEQARQYSQTTGTPPTQTKLLEEYYKLYEKCMEPEKMKEAFEGAFEHGRESSNHMLARWDQLNQIWTNNLDPFWTDENAKAEDMLADIEEQTNAALEQIQQEVQEDIQ